MIETSNHTAGTTRRGRLQVILLAVVFLGPLALAAYLYVGPTSWRPAGQTNHGELIQPVIRLPELALVTPYGEPTSETFLRGKWTLAYLNRGPCDSLCEQTLIKIRQIRLAIGSEADRVQRLYLATGAFPDEQWLATGHPGLISADPSSAPDFAAAIDGLGSGLYIIDPLANLMMAYPVDAGHKAVHSDLKKLLKISRIG